MIELTLSGQEETEQLGAALWQALPRQAWVFLRGDLGAGKTTLARGLLRAAGHQGAVKSPTYTLVEEYAPAEQRIFHFDLYRLKDPEELEWIGIDDYLRQTALCLIEWPEMGQDVLPGADLELRLTHAGDDRIVQLIRPVGSRIPEIKLIWKNNDLLL